MKHHAWKITALTVLISVGLAITAFAAQNVSWTKVKLSGKGVARWNFERTEQLKKKNVAGYEIEVYENNGFSTKEWELIECMGKTRHEKLEITEPGTYSFRVRARMLDGSVTNWSPESNAVTINEKKLNRIKNNNAGNKPDPSKKEKHKEEKHKKGWALEDGTWSYYTDDGSELTGWLHINGRWYYLDENGEMLTGWIRNGEKVYYLDEESGAMATGETTVDGENHTFDASGAKADDKIVEEQEIEDTEVQNITIE
ncbi:MAG: hypothetical protein IJR62_03615 [Lachnospiraceae bacterium]|nr:hypothetical protein [Lachnospiraceae bacterium]